VASLDKSNGLRVGRHDDGVGRYRFRNERHALNEGAGNDARRREAYVVAAREVIRAKDFREISDTCVVQALDMLLIFRLPAANYFSVQCAKRGSRNDRLGASADAHEDVNGGIAEARRNCHRDIAVGE